MLGLVGMTVFLSLRHMSSPSTTYTKLMGGLFSWPVGAPAKGFLYASCIVLLAQEKLWKKRLAPPGALGHSALSNDPFQGAVFVLIFHSYGLGLYAKVGPLAGIGLAILIFPLQVLLTIWWLMHFQFGPAEWFWRSLTSGKFQPMRLKQVAA